MLHFWFIFGLIYINLSFFNIIIAIIINLARTSEGSALEILRYLFFWGFIVLFSLEIYYFV